MEKVSSLIDKAQDLGIIESVIATKLVGPNAVSSRRIVHDFARYARGLTPDERRGILNEGFTEAVAAHLEAIRLPDAHPQKEYAEMRARTISEFMGWLGNDSGDVANVKAGRNDDGTYQRMSPLQYKTSLAVDGYAKAVEDEEAEIAEAIKQTTKYSFMESLEDLIHGTTSSVSTGEVSSTLDKVRSSADKSKARIAPVIAATALSVAAVASTASPSAASEKAPEISEIDSTKINDIYANAEQSQPYKLSVAVKSAQVKTDPAVIKEVSLSDTPAPKVKGTPKEATTDNVSAEAGAATALLKTPMADTISFTPETVKVDLPETEKSPVKREVPRVISETFAPEPIKADLPKVERVAPKAPAVPKEITDGLAPDIVKIDSGLDEKAPKISIVAPAPNTPATPRKTEAPAPAPKPETPAPTPEATSEQQQFSLAAQKLIDRGGEWKNRGIIMKIFIDSGMKPMYAAAFVGNFMVEAPTLDPATHQGWGGPGRGFAQWGNDENPALDRFGYDGTRGLVQFAKERGTSWDNLETQAYFVLHELQTTEKGAYAKIMATTTREDAAMAVSTFYERPGEPHNPRRVESANIVAGGYNEELKAIRAAAQPPAAPSLEITTVDQRDHDGKVGDIPYAYQLDPRWANMALPHKGGPIGPVACNPTSLSMVAMAIGDKTATPDKVYARYIADDRISKDGAHQQSLLDLAPAFGLRANLIPNDIEVFKKVIKDGGKIILSGNTNGRLLPSPGHFVVVYGISESGNMLIADPGNPRNNGQEFSLQDQINASNNIRAQLGTTNAGLHYNAVALYAAK